MRKSTLVLTAVLACVGGTVALGQFVVDNKVNLHLASLTPVDGFDARAFGDVNVYVSKRVALTEAALLTADTSTSRNGDSVEISLSDPGLRRLRSLIRRNNVDQMAVISNGRIIAVDGFTLDSSASSLTISGLSALEAGQITDLIALSPVGATITLVSSQSRVYPDRPVSVDIFVNGMVDLRTFQVSLEVIGGTAGTVAIEDMEIDRTRSDYVFGTLQKVDAADKIGHRVGGVLISGGVDATEMSYLGTATLRPSADAQGTFRVTVKGGDRSTLLWTSQNTPVKFRVEAATISVGTKRKASITDR